MRKTFSLKLLAISLIIMITSAGCGSTSSILSSGSTLLSTLGSNPNLSTITSLLKTPGLSDLLGSAIKGPFTLLAPTDDAFKALPASTMTNLQNPANVSQVANLLKNSIVPGKLDAASVEASGVKTAAGNPVNLNGVNLGNVLEAGNVNVIPIDKVII